MTCGRWNGACIRARDLSVDASASVASMVTIDEIASRRTRSTRTARSMKPVAEALTTMATWFERVRRLPTSTASEAQAWFRGSPSRASTCRRWVSSSLRSPAGVENIAVWGYRSCAIVTDLNPDSAAKPEVVWEEVCRLMQSSRLRPPEA